MPTFACSLNEETTPLNHVWEHTVGSGHAALALRADWRAQLERCRRELGFRHVRFHGLLTHPMDIVVHRDDKALYSFFNADQIFDYLLSIGMKPFVELSFMPDALASGTKTAFSYRANVTAPKDPRQWTALIRKAMRHWIERYGAEEVRSWYFEVWNEPNLTVFGTGLQEDYFTLYRLTVEAIKSVDGALRVGGPATANGEWVADFVAFTQKHDLAADFITTHQYPTDAFGSPGDDTEHQLAKSTRGFMRERALDARREAAGRPLYYTEWSTSSNPRDKLHDEPFAAAFATNILMSVDDTVDGYSWWTFSDIFDENQMPGTAFEGGFGLLSIHGIAKPVYRAFELLHKLGHRQLVVDGRHDTVSAWVVMSDDGTRATLLLTNHALPLHSVRTETVRFELRDAPTPLSASIERVDDEHANAPGAWRHMGQPNDLHEEKLEQLQEASRLVVEKLDFHYADGVTVVELQLPPHGVAAVTLELGPSAT